MLPLAWYLRLEIILFLLNRYGGFINLLRSGSIFLRDYNQSLLTPSVIKEIAPLRGRNEPAVTFMWEMQKKAVQLWSNRRVTAWVMNISVIGGQRSLYLWLFQPHGCLKKRLLSFFLIDNNQHNGHRQVVSQKTDVIFLCYFKRKRPQKLDNILLNLCNLAIGKISKADAAKNAIIGGLICGMARTIVLYNHEIAFITGSRVFDAAWADASRVILVLISLHKVINADAIMLMIAFYSQEIWKSMRN